MRLFKAENGTGWRCRYLKSVEDDLNNSALFFLFRKRNSLASHDHFRSSEETVLQRSLQRHLLMHLQQYVKPYKIYVTRTLSHSSTGNQIVLVKSKWSEIGPSRKATVHYCKLEGSIQSHYATVQYKRTIPFHQLRKCCAINL